MTKISFVVMALLLGGCACWSDQAKMNTPACIVAHDVVDCTTSAFESSLPFFAGIVGKLISGGVDPNNIPWDAIAVQAEGMGIKDGGCFLAQLKQLMFGKAQVAPEMMAMHQAVSNSLDGYKKKHFGSTSVKFKIKESGGKEVLL